MSTKLRKELSRWSKKGGLTELCISDRKVGEVPPNISHIKTLKTLWICHNSIEKIPDEIGGLTNLTELNLTWNRLMTIPEQIYELTLLETLDLSHNVFSSIPDGINRLANLKTLLLNNNKLKTLPEGISSLPNLRTLQCSHNYLNAFPDRMYHLKELTHLYANNNALTGFPRNISKMTNLKCVYLYDNHITEIPTEVCLLAKLRNVQLANNHVERLPLEIVKCTRLEELNLLGNPMVLPKMDTCEKGCESIMRFLNERLAKLTHGVTKHILEVGSLNLSAAMLKNGEVYMWGVEDDVFYETGMLHFGNEPVKVDYPESMMHVSLGWYHVLAISEVGRLYVFGNGEDGRLGNGSNKDIEKPLPIDIGKKKKTRFLVCSAGAHHSLALATDGRVFSWGRGFRGELGHGDLKSVPHPKLVTALKSVKCLYVLAGMNASYSVTKDGEVYAWGANESGKLGLGQGEDVLGQVAEPRLVQSFKGEHITQISAGLHHAAALSDSGVVYTWGNGKQGQLGDGCFFTSATPKVVQKLLGQRIKLISCGGNFTMALTLFGDVFLCGKRFDGLNEATPMQMVKMAVPFAHTKLSAISSGAEHSLFVTVEGEMYSCGSTSNGKLGIKKYGDRSAQKENDEDGEDAARKVTVPHRIRALDGKGVVGWRRSRKK